MKRRPELFFSGTSGLVLPVPNKSFYPDEFKDKTRLSYYSFLFNSIEINSFFYKLPRKQTVIKWSNEVHDNFRFTFKLWKEITHQKLLVYNPDDIFKFMDAISGVGDKKGCLLIQFPGKINIEYLEHIDSILNDIHFSGQATGWRLHVEFRHDSLYHPDAYALLKKHNANTVIHDIEKSATPLEIPVGKSVYIRFHGPEKGYRGNYTDEVLLKYAERITQWIKKKKEVYAYFNNTLGNAVNNLITLNKLTNSVTGR